MEKINSNEEWEFWKPLVTNEDGTLNLEAVKNELADFKFIMNEVSNVYYQLTDGKFSKINYKSSVIIDEVERLTEERFETALSDMCDDGEIDEQTYKHIEKIFRNYI